MSIQHYQLLTAKTSVSFLTLLSLHLNHEQKDSLAVWWLGLSSFTANDPGSTPGQGAGIPQVDEWSGQKKNKIIINQ